MAKSRSIGGIYASLSLRDAAFTKGLTRARKSLNSFGSMALKSGAVAAGAMAAGLVVGTKGALSMVDAVGDLSAATGVSIADMMKLQRSYADGGRDAGKAATDIGKMQKSIFDAASGGENPFESIRLGAQELLKLSPAQQFDAIGEAIMRIQNPAERTAKAMEIFGRSGMGLTTVFGTLKDSEKVLGNMPELAQKFGGAIDEANDALGRLPVKSDQFFVGFTAGIIGELLPNLKKIDDYDFTNMGQNLGTAFAQGMQMITSGDAWQLFELHALKAIETIRSSLVNGLAANLNIIFDVLTGKDGKSGDDYFNAGIDANIEKIDELEKRIAKIMDSNKSEFVAKSNAAAAISMPSPIAKPILDVAAKELGMSTMAASTPKSLDVNEYQRRGLSLGGSIATPNKDELKTLQSIDKTLKEAKKTGGLTWD